MSKCKIFLNNYKSLQISQVLQWYVDLNSGGTPHTKREIKRVKDMIVACDNDDHVEQDVKEESLVAGQTVIYAPNGTEIDRGVVENVHQNIIGIDCFDVRLADGSTMKFNGAAFGKSVFVCGESDDEKG